MLKRYSVFSNIKLGNTKAFLTSLRLHLCFLCQCEWVDTSAELLWLRMMNGWCGPGGNTVHETCRGL